MVEIFPNLIKKKKKEIRFRDLNEPQAQKKRRKEREGKTIL